MKHQLSLFLGAMLLVLVVSVLGCKESSPSAPSTTSTTAVPESPTAPTQPMPPSNVTTPAVSGQSSPADVARLGAVGEPSVNPRGLLIRSFTSTSSPLVVLGVKEGDVITSCNGQAGQLGLRISQALEGLQNRGETITLVVMRDGKSVTLTRSEKLPPAETTG